MQVSDNIISKNDAMLMLDVYLKQSMHLDDPVAKEYIKSFKVQNWQDCFEKNDSIGLIPVLQDNGIIDGYTHGLVSPPFGIPTVFFACKSVDNKERVKYILSQLVPHLSEALRIGASNRIHAVPLHIACNLEIIKLG